MPGPLAPIIPGAQYDPAQDDPRIVQMLRTPVPYPSGALDKIREILFSRLMQNQGGAPGVPDAGGLRLPQGPISPAPSLRYDPGMTGGRG